MTVADLLEWEAGHGPIPPACAVLLHTGWDRKWGTARFAEPDDDGTLHHPGFSVAAVEHLLRQGNLGNTGALGTDAFSPDLGADTAYAVSKLLYREHRISLEILANLDQVPEGGFHILAGGAVHHRGPGSPATIYALL